MLKPVPTRCDSIHVVVLKKGIQVKFFTLDQNVGKSLKRTLTKFELSTPFRFKILHFKISRFPVISVMPFCQYCDKQLTF